MRDMSITLFLTAWVLSLSAQPTILPEIISSAGESMQHSSIQLDWTLGEIAITTIDNSTLIVSQGFHQPNFTITNNSEPPEHIGEIKVFPNPTTETLNIIVKSNQNHDIKVQFIDLYGRTISTSKAAGHQINYTTNTTHLPNGSYYINVFVDKKRHPQTFKIQKIK